MITRSERLLTHSKEYLRCWIRRLTAIIVFQSPSVFAGLFLLPEFQKNSVFSKFDGYIVAISLDIFKNCCFLDIIKDLTRGLEKLIYGAFFSASAPNPPQKFKKMSINEYKKCKKERIISALLVYSDTCFYLYNSLVIIIMCFLTKKSYL